MVHELVGINNGRVTVESENRQDLRVSRGFSRILPNQRVTDHPVAGPRPQPRLGHILRRSTLLQLWRPRRRALVLRTILPSAHAINPQPEIDGDPRRYETVCRGVPRV